MMVQEAQGVTRIMDLTAIKELPQVSSGLVGGLETTGFWAWLPACAVTWDGSNNLFELHFLLLLGHWLTEFSLPK